MHVADGRGSCDGGATGDQPCVPACQLQRAPILAGLGLQLHSSSESSWASPVDAAVQGIDGLALITGLPWWATLAITAAGTSSFHTAGQIHAAA